MLQCIQALHALAVSHAKRGECHESVVQLEHANQQTFVCRLSASANAHNNVASRIEDGRSY